MFGWLKQKKAPPPHPTSLMATAMHQSFIDDSDCHRTSRDASGCRAVATTAAPCGAGTPNAGAATAVDLIEEAAEAIIRVTALPYDFSVI
jgi:hypothetical protein